MASGAVVHGVKQQRAVKARQLAQPLTAGAAKRASLEVALLLA